MRRKSQRCWCRFQIESEQPVQYGGAPKFRADFISIVSRFSSYQGRFPLKEIWFLISSFGQTKVLPCEGLARLIFMTINVDTQIRGTKVVLYSVIMLHMNTACVGGLVLLGKKRRFLSAFHPQHALTSSAPNDFN